jgi:mono/diheme cytochrome c family protein
VTSPHLQHPEDNRLEGSTVRWMQSGALILALMVLAFPLYRIQEPGARASAAEERISELSAQGADIFSVSCTPCHGEDGLGATAPALNSQQFLTSATDDQIEGLIALGVPGSAMAAYSIDFGGPLTQEQIVAIAVYLRSLEDTAPDNPNWRDMLAGG